MSGMVKTIRRVGNTANRIIYVFPSCPWGRVAALLGSAFVDGVAAVVGVDGCAVVYG
jgi:hypothetical protein